jgi:hypothetical protein
MVEGSRAEFDAGFRSVEMRVGEVGAVSFYFESDAAVPDAAIEITVPGILDPVLPGEGNPWRQRIALVQGQNEFAIEFRAVAAGGGYVVARVPRSRIPAQTC